MYRWFVGLSPDDPVWDPTTFTKNRDRLQNGEVFAKFMTKLLNHPQVNHKREGLDLLAKRASRGFLLSLLKNPRLNFQI